MLCAFFTSWWKELRFPSSTASQRQRSKMKFSSELGDFFLLHKQTVSTYFTQTQFKIVTFKLKLAKLKNGNYANFYIWR